MKVKRELMLSDKHTGQAFAAHRQVRCPFCGSKQVLGLFIRVEAGKAFHAVECEDCESGWMDILPERMAVRFVAKHPDCRWKERVKIRAV